MSLFRQLLWDLRLQKRYYFWAIALVISAVWLVLLINLNDSIRLRWLPALIFFDLSNIGLLFIAGCLYLERRQGTLYALVISPVSCGRWLTVKLISLSLLTAACAILIVIFSGTAVNWLLLIPAVLANAAVFILCGFLLVLPFDDLLNYFTGMALALLILSLPLIGYFEIYVHWLYWLLPTQPVLVLLTAGFATIDSMSIAVSCLLCLGWVIVLYRLALQRFRKFIAERPWI